MALSLEWKLSNGPLADIGFAIANITIQVANQQVADLAELFPLKGNWELRGHIDEEWLIVRITERYSSGVPVVGEFKGDELDYVKRQILPFKLRPYSELFVLLGLDWFSFQRFTYVGPYHDSYACWPDLNKHLID